MTNLFSAFETGPLRLTNRIVVSPMCQYSADDGSASDWHLQHLMTLAMSGAALVTVEATAVERGGRISHGDLGLYSDANERALARVIAAARAVAPPGTKFAIQLGHAGRKASAQRPWEGGGALGRDEDPWPTVAPSPIAFADGWHVPGELDEANLDRTRDAFVAAAKRAVRIGFDVIDLHVAHGYLLHQFHSPLSNKRDDAWGGDAERRRAYPLSVARAMREAIPEHVLLSARITGSDWAEGGLTPDDGVVMARELKVAGVGMVCVTSGGVVSNARIQVGHDYQVPFAERVRREADIATQAVGLVTNAGQANALVAEGRADMVALARALLDDPRWPWQAARELGADMVLPAQYRRAAPPAWPGRGK
jgi:2,4-dienoyl-CoA reductase-like NADH-dependent reductase (Old Yellow Enzyme family)